MQIPYNELKVKFNGEPLQFLGPWPDEEGKLVYVWITSSGEKLTIAIKDEEAKIVP